MADSHEVIRVTKKPNITIAADKSYSKSDLKELDDSLQTGFDLEFKEYVRLSADPLPPILAFALHAISLGYFTEIGKDLWNLTKETIIKVACKPKPNGISSVDFSYSVNGREASLHCTAKNKEVLRSALDTIPKTVELIERNGHRYSTLMYDKKKKVWEITNEVD